MSNYVKYSQLTSLMTNYSKRMRYLSNRIFGEVVRPTHRKSMKVVKLFQKQPLHLNQNVIYYYPRHVETHKLMMNLRDYGLFRDEHQDFTEEMERLRLLRGKPSRDRSAGKYAFIKASTQKKP